MRVKRKKLIVALTMLVLIGVPLGIVYQRSLHHAQLGKSRAKLRSHLQALFVYAGNNRDQLPSADRWPDALIEEGMLYDYLMESEYHDAPGDAYVYVEGVELFAPDKIMVYENVGHWREGVLTGFADGHVEMLPHDEFNRLLAEQALESP